MQDNPVFLDTNVLVYFYSKTEPHKQQQAAIAIKENPCCISIQVLNEYCNVCLKKLNLSFATVRQDIEEILSVCTLVAIDENTVRHALTVKDRYGFSYYDSFLVATGIDAGCTRIFSEDLSDGQIVESARIVNIFRKPS